MASQGVAQLCHAMYVKASIENKVLGLYHEKVMNTHFIRCNIFLAETV